MMNPWSSVNQAYLLIEQEEKQRQTQCNASSLIAMFTQVLNQGYGQQTASHKQFDKLVGGLECSYCHGKNHARKSAINLLAIHLNILYIRTMKAK